MVVRSAGPRYFTVFTVPIRFSVLLISQSWTAVLDWAVAPQSSYYVGRVSSSDNLLDGDSRQISVHITQ